MGGELYESSKRAALRSIEAQDVVEEEEGRVGINRDLLEIKQK